MLHVPDVALARLFLPGQGGSLGAGSLSLPRGRVVARAGSARCRPGRSSSVARVTGREPTAASPGSTQELAAGRRTVRPLLRALAVGVRAWAIRYFAYGLFDRA